MNNTLLNKAEKWLDELGVKTIACPTCLMVSRDSIENLYGIGVSYQAFLDEVKIGIESNRIHWTHKDDKWLYMDTL